MPPHGMAWQAQCSQCRLPFGLSAVVVPLPLDSIDCGANDPQLVLTYRALAAATSLEPNRPVLLHSRRTTASSPAWSLLRWETRKAGTSL